MGRSTLFEQCHINPVLVLAGIFPNILSKFVLAFGLQSALDPFLILLIDATMPSVRHRKATQWVESIRS